MRHENCKTIQKWINLMSKMINKSKGEGHYVMMDSAYMGNIMAQVGQEVWGINMVGNVECNRSGVMKAGTSR